MYSMDTGAEVGQRLGNWGNHDLFAKTRALEHNGKRQKTLNTNVTNRKPTRHEGDSAMIGSAILTLPSS